MGVVAWLLVFLIWATSTVFESWGAMGPANVYLVLLSATWFIGLGLVVIVLAHTRRVARYLTEAYRDGEEPWLVRQLRKVFG